MQKWMRSGLLSLGLAGAMVGGGAVVAPRADQRQLQLVLDGLRNRRRRPATAARRRPPRRGPRVSRPGAQGNCPNM